MTRARRARRSSRCRLRRPRLRLRQNARRPRPRFRPRRRSPRPFVRRAMWAALTVDSLCRPERQARDELIPAELAEYHERCEGQGRDRRLLRSGSVPWPRTERDRRNRQAALEHDVRPSSAIEYGSAEPGCPFAGKGLRRKVSDWDLPVKARPSDPAILILAFGRPRAEAAAGNRPRATPGNRSHRRVLRPLEAKMRTAASDPRVNSCRRDEKTLSRREKRKCRQAPHSRTARNDPAARQMLLDTRRAGPLHLPVPLLVQ